MCLKFLLFLVDKYREQREYLGERERERILKRILENLNIKYKDVSTYSYIFNYLICRTYNQNWTTMDYMRNTEIANWNFRGSLSYYIIRDFGIDTVLNNLDLNWNIENNFWIISNISIDYILNNPNIKWNMYAVCKHNPSVTIKHMNDYQILIDCHHYNYLLDVPLIQKYIKWYIQPIEPNTAETENYIFTAEVDPILISYKNIWNKIYNKYLLHPNIDHLSSDPNLTIDIILKNHKLAWNLKLVYNNLNIDKALYLSKIEKCGASEYATISDILNYPYYNWDFSRLSSNSNIKLIDIENNLHLPWNWKCISQNKNLTMDFIKKHIDKNFCWKEISKHDNITVEHIQENPEYPWDYEYISENINLTVNFILQNQDKNWNIIKLSNNQLTYNKEYIYQKHIKKYVSSTSFCIKQLTSIINLFYG